MTVACSEEMVAVTAETASVSHCFMSKPETDVTNTGNVTLDLEAAEKIKIKYEDSYFANSGD